MSIAKLKITILYLIAGLLLSSCASRAPIARPVETPSESIVPSTKTKPNALLTEPTSPATEETVPTMQDQIREYVAGMTLQQKANQLFFVRPEAIGIDCFNPDNLAGIQNALNTHPVGGIVFFDQNLYSPEQLTCLTKNLQSSSPIPLFLATDEEGGTVARIANHGNFDVPHYGSAASIADGGIPADARNMGSEIGSYLRELGLNFDFAPVADVNSNPQNPVIGSRAFSSDPDIVRSFARSFADGLLSQQVIPTLKHFPGHGDTAEDSHETLAVSYHSMEEMTACEWVPYACATDQLCIMAGHIACPELTGDFIPATLSHSIITGILKEQLHFSGLIITDSMEMGAISNQYSSSEAAIAALMAGCHMILMPTDLEEAVGGVLSAVQSGEFSENQLDEIVAKILEFKLIHGVFALPQ